MFLAVFSLIENESLQIKTKNREVHLRLSDLKQKTFLNFIFFVNLFNNVIWKHKDIH